MVKNGIIRIQVCVFCLDEDNFSFCDKCSKVVCLTDDFFDSRSCMDLCEGCDKWFCNKCQKDQGFEFWMHCGEKRIQSTDGCLVRMGTFTKPMCASNILLSFSPLTSFLRCGARQETNISVRIASKHARCAMRMSAMDACVTAWMDIARGAEKGISMSWLLRVSHCTCFALMAVANLAVLR